MATYIAASIFAGGIIGSLIVGNGMCLVVCAILLAFDIFIGISLQFVCDNKQLNERSKQMYIGNDSGTVHNRANTEKVQSCNAAFSKAPSSEKQRDYQPNDDVLKNNKTCAKMCAIFLKERAQGDIRVIHNKRKDEAHAFLRNLCRTMEHAPSLFSLDDIIAVSTGILNARPTVVYFFDHSPISICQNAFVLLVFTKENTVRFFTVETSISTYVLCEYSGNRHINYGPVDIESVQERISDLLD